MADEEEEDSAEDVGGVNGVLRDGRSISSTVHDRSRTSTTTAPAGTVSKQSSKHHHSQQSHRHSITHSQPVESTKGSPPNARETFLNYFFGQNGPGPIAGSSMERSHGSQHIPIGRDMSGSDGSMPGGLMAGKRSLDGNNAAYDMKSLGKHIEAVSNFIPDWCRRWIGSRCVVKIPSEGGSQLTIREEMETSLIRSLIASYFSIVRQSIQDLIPKAIMHFLVNHTTQNVQNRLVASLYKPELFADLLNEDEALVAERTRVKALLDAYKDAFRVLSDVNLKSI
jgi:dynamin 1-like protein